jgi:F-type H+-transporting ATPase subunit gamma
MPSLKAIRTRIASVKNTQKITKAMKLVAAARLRRAQDQMLAARPYSSRLADMVHDLLGKMVLDPGEAAHPLLEPRKIERVRLIVVSSDRGLAGGYNSNLNRRTERFLVEEAPKYPHIELAIVGRKSREHFRRRKGNIVREYPGVTSETAHERAQEIGKEAVADFLEKKVDAVFVVYNEFKSAISQVVQVKQLLPLAAPAATDTAGPRSLVDFEYEPSRAEVLSTLVPLYLETMLLQVMLEAIASELGARMSAMDSATKNAKEMIASLTLQFNRARQAAITKELVEIVSGAEALKG